MALNDTENNGITNKTHQSSFTLPGDPAEWAA